MKPMKSLLVVVGAGALTAAPLAAFADPAHCPPGHAKKGWCSDHDDDHRYRGDWDDDDWDDDDWDDDDDDEWDDDDNDRRAFYQQRRAYEEGFRDGVRKGRYLREDADYRVIRDYQRYGYAPPPRGHYYAQVDGEVLLVQAATQLIVQALADQR